MALKGRYGAMGMPMIENNYDTHFLQTEGGAVRIVEYACWSIGGSGLKGTWEDGQHHLHKGAVHFYTSLHPASTVQGLAGHSFSKWTSWSIIQKKMPRSPTCLMYLSFFMG